MEKFIENSYLYDFYGELLTEHQREIYEAVVFDDLSLSEAAASLNVSRQGIHDIIKRCNNTLNGYEEKLHLVEKFLSLKEKVNKIKELSKEDVIDRESIVKIADDIIENY